MQLSLFEAPKHRKPLAGCKGAKVSGSELNDLLSLRLPSIALSIKQPWASLIIHGGKDIENRSWYTNFRGPILIHASKKRDGNERYAFEMLKEDRNLTWDHAFELNWSEIPCGGIVGVAEIVDCVNQHRSPWFVGEYGLVLSNIKPLPFFPCRGALSFWKCNYPHELLKSQKRVTI